MDRVIQRGIAIQSRNEAACNEFMEKSSSLIPGVYGIMKWLDVYLMWPRCSMSGQLTGQADVYLELGNKNDPIRKLVGFTVQNPSLITFDELIIAARDALKQELVSV